MPAEPFSAPWGLVLAAGAGRRFGGPKALARTPAGTPWVQLAVRALRDGGCAEVLVALGAGADEAIPLVPPGARIVRVAEWDEGVSASLRAGLATAARDAAADVPALLVLPVDTPEVPPTAVDRLTRRAAPEAVAYASYRGAPGHPVLLGRGHWAAIAASVRGDTGARAYLDTHGGEAVECGDLWSGADRDTP